MAQKDGYRGLFSHIGSFAVLPERDKVAGVTDVLVPDTGVGRRRRAPRGQGRKLREEILAAAERLLRETGDQEAVSIRAVADAVGVTPPSIYLHFADKTDLIFAIC